jgi:hypothetical protein
MIVTASMAELTSMPGGNCARYRLVRRGSPSTLTHSRSSNSTPPLIHASSSPVGKPLIVVSAPWHQVSIGS